MVHESVHKLDKIDQYVDKYECLKCQESFIHFRVLLAHVDTCSVDSASPSADQYILRSKFKSTFNSEQCKESFISIEEFNGNQHVHHNQQFIFNCEYCNKKFVHKFNLIRHRIRHHSSRCSKCSLNIVEKNDLNNHICIDTNIYYDNKEKVYRCFICSKEFIKINNIAKHIQSHSREEIYKCEHCEQSFSKGEELEAHINIHQQNGTDKSHICPQCSKSLTTRSNLVTHIRTQVGEKSYKCELCNRRWAHQSNLIHHYEKYPNHKVNSNQILVKVQHHSKVSDIDKKNEKVNKKKKCHTSINNKTENLDKTDNSKIPSAKKYSTLINNKNKVSEQKKHKCSTCGSEFNLLSRLVKHMRLHKGSEWCQLCHKICSSKYSLKCHIMKCHTGVTFNCDQCSDFFTSSYRLKLHKRLHTGEKPYKCSYCKTRFLYRRDMLKHLQTHDRAKIYECRSCKKKFVKRGNLIAHVKTHKSGKTNFNCKECGKHFLDQGGLSNHRRSHSTERPFKCEICPKMFLHEITLLKHIVNHTNRKSFNCQLCENSFRSNRSLIKHIATHDNENI